MRAGDVVKHSPVGGPVDRWVLAYGDEDQVMEAGDVSPCGWPEIVARVADCTRLEAATDKRRMEMLEFWVVQGLSDVRARVARRTLIKLQVLPSET